MAEPRKIVDIVHEALVARGWTEGETTQIIHRLLVSGEDATIDYDMVLPFGKYRGWSISMVAIENLQYLHWLLTQDFVTERYPLLKSVIQSMLLH